MEGISEIKVAEIYREANKCVDSLAKFSLNLHGGCLSFNECPDFMYSLLLGDISGIG